MFDKSLYVLERLVNGAGSKVNNDVARAQAPAQNPGATAPKVLFGRRDTFAHPQLNSHSTTEPTEYL